MYNLEHNILARSRNHCCHGDATMGYFYFCCRDARYFELLATIKDARKSSHKMADIFVRF
jgi:hypothetical protein